MDQPLKQRIQDDVKDAMRSKDRQRLNTLRLLTAAIKQREVDERIDLGDTAVTTLIEKMVRQRRDSIEHYAKAGRQDLIDIETYELELLQGYLPEPMDTTELEALVNTTISNCGATGIRDMGKVMAQLRDQIQGRADMAAVSAMVKNQLDG